jgi:hypothetical protein
MVDITTNTVETAKAIGNSNCSQLPSALRTIKAEVRPANNIKTDTKKPHIKNSRGCTAERGDDPDGLEDEGLFMMKEGLKNRNSEYHAQRIYEP